MKWDMVLRVAGIAGFLVAYGLFLKAGSDVTVLLAVLASIGTLVMPEFVDHLPFGPNK